MQLTASFSLAKTKLCNLSMQPQDAGGGAGEGSDSPLPADMIDMDTFGQLLEMDDEDDREFSKEIVWNFFDQASTTFEQMDEAL